MEGGKYFEKGFSGLGKGREGENIFRRDFGVYCQHLMGGYFL